MHYAEFGEDEVGPFVRFLAFLVVSTIFCFLGVHRLTRKKQSAALLAAIKEYDANKWKVIGQKVNKPAKVGSTAPSWISHCNDGTIQGPSS